MTTEKDRLLPLAECSEVPTDVLDEARICLRDAAVLMAGTPSWSSRFRAAAERIEAALYAGHEGVVPKAAWPGWWVGVHGGKVVCEANHLMTCEHLYAEVLGTDPAIQAVEASL